MNSLSSAKKIAVKAFGGGKRPLYIARTYLLLFKNTVDLNYFTLAAVVQCGSTVIHIRFEDIY